MELKAVVPREQIRSMSTNEAEITDIETGDREMIPTHKTPSGRPTIISADDVESHDEQIHQEIYGTAKPMSSPENVIRVTADNTNETTHQLPTAEESYPKVGRNDPCPCNSGKKYKKCHGA